MRRIDGRDWNELRPVKITPGFQKFAEGSVLIEVGNTMVACTATVEDRVPQFLRGSGSGWVTAEYSMLPRSTVVRTSRDGFFGRVSGRNQEIQRLIGRSLRAVTELAQLGERTITLDCDVIQADGGTRTAAITGAYIALYQAIYNMSRMGLVNNMFLKEAVAATSVGISKGRLLLDLNYDEDSGAEVDFNIVMTSSGELVEIQGTAETKPFSREQMDEMLDLAQKGINELLQIQQHVIRDLGMNLG
ncbi:MAG: ribonuclease PH [Dehalococcoidales bacterium]|jgi:ribonuclease PH|nr:ribonuclease PH [Dehalococcoidales bacterium]MDD4322077.1 ribonuclease PH [Dehalococcoidales bacterium]MDD4793648.1 ribonuclease PH [Dehalococcoidales bacterium]MDD5122266.1 ribonuclease PH [Dehalococcoidales bacterium]MDD5497869.1 ribonuclease PH [Dehalococcoidales bacterium]